MSEKQTNQFSDDQRKLTADDDKFGLYESSTTDSGFMSSGNLLVSGDLTHEEDEKSSSDNNKSKSTDNNNSKMRYMSRLDSGVDLGLSENFSNISLKDPPVNDLSCSNDNIKPNVTTTTTTTTSSSSTTTPVDSIIDEFPWKGYFEQDEDGDTPLHLAIAHGFVELVMAIIRSAPLPQLLDTLNDNSIAPLHLAVLTRQSKIVRWLIVAGAKLSPRNCDGDTPLHLAVRNNDLLCCKAITDPIQNFERDQLCLNYLLATTTTTLQQSLIKLNLDQWNYQGETCVHLAAKKGHVNILRHLINCGADINAREGLMGYTALHYAIVNSDENLIKFLLNECGGLNVGIVNYGGRSVLELGCNIPMELVQILRSKGVPTPENSDVDEDIETDKDSEDEITYENSKMFVPNLVNASA